MAMPINPNPIADDGGEPAVNKSTLVALVSGVAMFAIVRLDRSVDILTDGEIDNLQGLMVIAAPIIAGILIRKLVTPTSKVAAIVQREAGTIAAQQVGVAVTEAVAKKEEDIKVFLEAEAETRAAEAEPVMLELLERVKAEGVAEGRKARPAKKAAAKRA